MLGGKPSTCAVASLPWLDHRPMWCMRSTSAMTRNLASSRWEFAFIWAFLQAPSGVSFPSFLMSPHTVAREDDLTQLFSPQGLPDQWKNDPSLTTPLVAKISMPTGSGNNNSNRSSRRRSRNQRASGTEAHQVSSAGSIPSASSTSPRTTVIKATSKSQRTSQTSTGSSTSSSGSSPLFSNLSRVPAPSIEASSSADSNGPSGGAPSSATSSQGLSSSIDSQGTLLGTPPSNPQKATLSMVHELETADTITPRPWAGEATPGPFALVVRGPFLLMQLCCSILVFPSLCPASPPSATRSLFVSLHIRAPVYHVSWNVSITTQLIPTYQLRMFVHPSPSIFRKDDRANIPLPTGIHIAHTPTPNPHHVRLIVYYVCVFIYHSKWGSHWRIVLYWSLSSPPSLWLGSSSPHSLVTSSLFVCETWPRRPPSIQPPCLPLFIALL